LVTILRQLGVLNDSTAERSWIPILSFVTLLPGRLRPPITKMDTESSFYGALWPKRKADHSSPSSAEVKNAWSSASTVVSSHLHVAASLSAPRC